MLTRFLDISDGSIQDAAATIQSGGLVVYPTDTVYGLGCDPFDAKAITRVSAVKERNKGNFPVLVDTLSRARELGDLRGDAEKLAVQYWPGPLTIVVPSIATLPHQVVGLEKMVGLR